MCDCIYLKPVVEVADVFNFMLIYILQSRQTLHFSCSVDNILPATSTNKIAFPSRQTALSVQNFLLSSKHSTFQSVVYLPPFISG